MIEERKAKNKSVISGFILLIIFVLFLIYLSQPVNAKSNELQMIEATAYYDSYGHGYGADGRKLVEDLTIAGRICDLGKTALIYDIDMKLIGIYEFRDTGYGEPTGRGHSKILKGKSIGTIEAGECVDIYMKTKEKCKQFGRQKVYIQIIKAVG